MGLVPLSEGAKEQHPSLVFNLQNNSFLGAIIPSWRLEFFMVHRDISNLKCLMRNLHDSSEGMVESMRQMTYHIPQLDIRMDDMESNMIKQGVQVEKI